MVEKWIAGRFKIALPDEIQEVDGFIRGYLGLRKGNRYWSLTHLPTGHAVCFIEGTEETAKHIASEFHDAGDWSFSGIRGWKDPLLPKRAAKILENHSPIAFTMGNSHSQARADQITPPLAIVALSEEGK